jgi:glycerophosphoryl diester phosphodiesterase
MAPLIYAHRGASADFPEMSIAAYRGAIDQNADGFECDLRLTKDRVLICWHDSDLKRIAGSPLVVSKTTYAELLEIHPIITLGELLDLALLHQKNLALETKHPVPSGGLVERELCRYLQSREREIRASGIHIAIMSFSWLAMWRCRGWDTVFLSVHRVAFLLNPASARGPWISILDKMPIRKLPNQKNRTSAPTRRTREMKTFVWTVNSEEQAQLCLEKGVDVIITDRPAYIRTILENFENA